MYEYDLLQRESSKIKVLGGRSINRATDLSLFNGPEGRDKRQKCFFNRIISRSNKKTNFKILSES